VGKRRGIKGVNYFPQLRERVRDVQIPKLGSEHFEKKEKEEKYKKGLGGRKRGKGEKKTEEQRSTRGKYMDGRKIKANKGKIP